MPEPAAAPRDQPTQPPPSTPPSDGPRRRPARDDAEWRPRVEEALRAHAGNVAATARALGLHRTQLRRLLERYGLAADTAADTATDMPTDADDGESVD